MDDTHMGPQVHMAKKKKSKRTLWLSYDASKSNQLGPIII